MARRRGGGPQGFQMPEHLRATPPVGDLDAWREWAAARRAAREEAGVDPDEVNGAWREDIALSRNRDFWRAAWGRRLVQRTDDPDVWDPVGPPERVVAGRRTDTGFRGWAGPQDAPETLAEAYERTGSVPSARTQAHPAFTERHPRSPSAEGAAEPAPEPPELPAPDPAAAGVGRVGTSSGPHPYGWSHNSERKRLLAELRRKGGAACPRCGKAMDWRRPQTLDVGHSVPVVAGGGSSARRLEHSSCNRAHGARVGNARRGAPAPPPVPAVEDEPAAPPLRIAGKGHGSQYEHDLNRFGADVNPDDYPRDWTVGVDP